MIEVHISFWVSTTSSLYKYTWVELLDCLEVLFNFLGNFDVFCSGCTILHSQQWMRVPFPQHLCQNLFLVFWYIFPHTFQNSCLLWFWFSFSWLGIWNIFFLCLLAICMPSLGKFLCSIPLFTFYILLLSWSCHVLDINPLLDIGFANIFPHTADCHFILFPEGQLHWPLNMWQTKARGQAKRSPSQKDWQAS